jgi:hypothetical protein
MDEQEQHEPAPSHEYFTFLEALKEHGVEVNYLGTKKGEDKPETQRYYLPKGCIQHEITDDNLISFRKLNRREHRKIFPKHHKSRSGLFVRLLRK